MRVATLRMLWLLMAAAGVYADLQCLDDAGNAVDWYEFCSVPHFRSSKRVHNSVEAVRALQQIHSPPNVWQVGSLQASAYCWFAVRRSACEYRTEHRRSVRHLDEREKHVAHFESARERKDQRVRPFTRTALPLDARRGTHNTTILYTYNIQVPVQHQTIVLQVDSTC